jgi:hypothetical protein
MLHVLLLDLVTHANFMLVIKQDNLSKEVQQINHLRQILEPIPLAVSGRGLKQWCQQYERCLTRVKSAVCSCGKVFFS